MRRGLEIRVSDLEADKSQLHTDLRIAKDKHEALEVRGVNRRWQGSDMRVWGCLTFQPPVCFPEREVESGEAPDLVPDQAGWDHGTVDQERGTSPR